MSVTPTTTWRDYLRRGSFRGAQFLWEKADAEVGRKTARHDYPLRDECLIEDLGKAPAEFTLECLVIGPNYMIERDALIAAVEMAGPGLLVHPTWGMLNVWVSGKVRLSESTREGGTCRFTIPMVQQSVDWRPTMEPSTWEEVDYQCQQVMSFAVTTFSTRFVYAPSQVDRLQARFARLTASVERLRMMMAPPKIPVMVTALAKATLTLSITLSGLIRQPKSLAMEVQGFIGALSSITDYPRAALDSYRGLFDYGADETIIAPSTPSRAIEAGNAAALNSLVRQTAVMAACRLVPAVTFTSLQDALTVRDELTERLDELMVTSDDDLYGVLFALRAALVKHITVTAADLSRLIAWTPRTTIPALLAAHLMYGDATWSDDIISRNRVRRPGFVPGGIALEILTP